MNNVRKYLFPILLASFLLVVSVAPVFASTTANDTYPAAAPTSIPDEDSDSPIKDRAVQFLEEVYQRAGQLVEHVGTDLERTQSIEERVTKAIERQQEMGEDTSEIQTALNDFLTKIPGFEANYDKAAAIYETHSGFDAKGKVTDIDEASDTLQALKDTLMSTHQDWHEATSELRDVLKAYRDTHTKADKK